MQQKIGNYLRGRAGWIGLCVAILAVVSGSVISSQTSTQQVSHDGLMLQTDGKASAVYIDPEAHFDVYTKYMMLEPYVAFKKNWERDTKVAGRRVPKKYIKLMKVSAADLLQEVFQEVLEEKDGYPLVTEPDDDVLLLRPAIIDLVVTAPDVPQAGRSTTYVASSVSATLYLELYDSVTGDILGRAIDRQTVRDSGYMTWANSVTNRADAKRIYKRWAGWLREAWDEVHADFDKMQG
jgi:hypothetical protein